MNLEEKLLFLRRHGTLLLSGTEKSKWWCLLTITAQVPGVSTEVKSEHCDSPTEAVESCIERLSAMVQAAQGMEVPSCVPATRM